MSATADSGFKFSEMMKRKAPEYLDLLTAKTEKQFEKAFEPLLAKAVAHLETNKKNFKRLDEVGLSAVIAARLTIPGIAVSQEMHSNGHVDLTIEADHCTPPRRKLGEAKIYKTPSYHFKGLEQLIGRYSTGREGRGLLLIYFRKANIEGLIKRLRKKMDKSRPQRQKGKTTDLKLTWSFLSVHAHNSGRPLSVGHIGCNLHI